MYYAPVCQWLILKERERRATYAADYIVLADGALLGVGLEEVDFAQEPVLVMFELSDHDGGVDCGLRKRFVGAFGLQRFRCLFARAEIISAMLRDAGRRRSSDRAAAPPSHQTSHRYRPCLFCFRLLAIFVPNQRDIYRMPTVHLLDYVAGNIRSLVNAIEKVGYTVEWIKSPEDVPNAEVQQPLPHPHQSFCYKTTKLLEEKLTGSLETHSPRCRPLRPLPHPIQQLWLCRAHQETHCRR